MKKRKGEQRYYNNIAYSNDDHFGGSVRGKIDKSMESIQRLKNKGKPKQTQEIRLIPSLNNGDKLMKINSTTDINRGLNFG